MHCVLRIEFGRNGALKVSIQFWGQVFSTCEFLEGGYAKGEQDKQTHITCLGHKMPIQYSHHVNICYILYNIWNAHPVSLDTNLQELAEVSKNLDITTDMISENLSHIFRSTTNFLANCT